MKFLIFSVFLILLVNFPALCNESNEREECESKVGKPKDDGKNLKELVKEDEVIEWGRITGCCATYGVIGASVGAVSSWLFFPAFLTVAGWTGGGVSGGSLAAIWQSTMGGVIVKGGLFAFFQSIAAGGVTGAIVSAGAMAGSSIVAFCGSLEEHGFCSGSEIVEKANKIVEKAKEQMNR